MTIEARGRSIGAVWLRYFTGAEPGHGFVHADIPELAIGIVPDQRGRGIGRALLRAVAAMATDHGVDQISLSVEKDNPARSLYHSEGYRTTTSREHALTMVLDLTRRQGHHAGNLEHRDIAPSSGRVGGCAEHVRQRARSVEDLALSHRRPSRAQPSPLTRDRLEKPSRTRAEGAHTPPRPNLGPASKHERYHDERTRQRQ